MGQLMGGDEVITKTKLQSNLHAFYRKIRPYLNGTGGGGGAFYYDDLYERPVEADAIDMDSVVNPLPSESGGYVQRGAMSILASSNSINNFLDTISTPVTVERV